MKSSSEGVTLWHFISVCNSFTRRVFLEIIALSSKAATTIILCKQSKCKQRNQETGCGCLNEMGNKLAGFKEMPKSWVMFEELRRGCIMTFSVEVPSGPFQLALPMLSLISRINILLHHTHLSCLSFIQFAK